MSVIPPLAHDADGYQSVHVHDPVVLAQAMHLAFALEPKSEVASLAQQILSLALQAGYNALVAVIPQLIAALTAKYPVVGGLLAALQAILAQLQPVPTPKPVVPVVPGPVQEIN